jgi:type II secretory ATPase GspE/PulE/Tfp pilus assembly ATPase PilB-like protein
MLAVNYNVVSPSEAISMLAEERRGRSLTQLMIQAIQESDMLKSIAKEMGYRFYDMHSRDQECILDENIVRRCDIKMLTEHSALPLLDKSGKIVLAMANPMDMDILQYLKSKFPDMAGVALVPKSQVQSRLLYITDEFESQNPSGNVVPEFIDYLLQRAVGEGASDIHMRFMYDGTLMVRLRVDGVLRQIPFPPALKGRESEVSAAMMAKTNTMDSSNTREPQDGTFSFPVAGRSVDARVGMLPQIAGPNITVRILDPLTLRRRLEDMGFDVELVTSLRRAVASSAGCVLVVGPTGSGKTTTLYALLREVDAVSRNVLTVEDPVEYRLPYVGQTQIRSDIGDRSLTFSRALRSILRQDPDVVLVGEIRDTDTAKVAMEAAITGHLVLSTVHASSAPSAYTRLTEMGVPSYLVAEALSIVVSQRLVRQVHECCTIGPPTPEEQAILARLGIEGVSQVAHPVGCIGCAGNGFRGRIAVAEILSASPEIKAAITAGVSRDKIIEIARKNGWKPMISDAARHLRAGHTTISEINRAASVEDDSADGELDG